MPPLVEYETVADAAPVDAGDAAPVDAGDAAPPEAAPADIGDVTEAPVEPPVEEPWSLTRDEWEQTQYALQQIAQSFTAPPAQQAPPEEGQPPELDPFDPDSVKAWQDWREEQLLGRIEEMISPLAARAQAEHEHEQASLLKDAAHDVVTRKGEFLGDDQARAFARAQMLAAGRDALPEFAQRYGMSDLAAERALEQGYQQVKAYQDAIAKAAVEAHVNRNARLVDQHVEPGLGSGSALETTDGTPYKPGSLALKYGQRANALRAGN